MQWYCLPVSRQRDIAHILNRMQNGVVLTQVIEIDVDEILTRLIPCNFPPGPFECAQSGAQL